MCDWKEAIIYNQKCMKVVVIRSQPFLGRIRGVTEFLHPLCLLLARNQYHRFIAAAFIRAPQRDTSRYLSLKVYGAMPNKQYWFFALYGYLLYVRE